MFKAGSVVRRRLRLSALVALAAVIVTAVVLSFSGSGPAGSTSTPSLPADPAGSPAQDAIRAALMADDEPIDAVRAHATYVERGSAKRREIALTFDDGPGPTTPALLRYLTANGVPATFFLVGRAIREHTDVVRRQVEAGFSLGTHTESHAQLRPLTAAGQEREILSAADRITRISRHATRLFRPPYGLFDARTLEIVRAERMLMVLWNVNTKDYAAKTSSRQIVRKVLEGAGAGAIVLMHDGPGERPKTLRAVRVLVPALRRRGYRLVSLPEMLRGTPAPTGRHRR